MSNKKPVLIQSDFDNTITIGNVSEQIHDEFTEDYYTTLLKGYCTELAFRNQSVEKVLRNVIAKQNFEAHYSRL